MAVAPRLKPGPSRSKVIGAEAGQFFHQRSVWPRLSWKCEDPSWRSRGAVRIWGLGQSCAQHSQATQREILQLRTCRYWVRRSCRDYLHCCTETPRMFSVTHFWLALQTWNPQSAAFGVLELPGNGMGNDPVGSFTPGIEGGLMLGT